MCARSTILKAHIPWIQNWQCWHWYDITITIQTMNIWMVICVLGDNSSCLLWANATILDGQSLVSSTTQDVEIDLLNMTMHQCTRLTKTSWLSKFTRRQTTRRDKQFLLSPEGNYWQNELHFQPYPSVSRLVANWKNEPKNEITSWWIAAIEYWQSEWRFFSYPKCQQQIISTEFSQAKWQSCIKTSRSAAWFLSIKVRAILDGKGPWMTHEAPTRLRTTLQKNRKNALCWKINWPWILSILMVELLKNISKFITCAFEKSVP